MLKDISGMNPKGHVKLELYNEEGVFYTKQKNNLVVQSANEIIARMMSDPAKVLRVSQVDKGDASLHVNGDSLYSFRLSVQSEEKIQFEHNVGSANNEKIFQLEELKGITQLDKVSVNGVDLIIDEDVFLKDPDTGAVEFKEAPVEIIDFYFHRVKNPYMKVIAGTESVLVNGVKWEKSALPSHANRKYRINYRTGEILFEQPVQKVEVAYDYNMNYSLGFMALGGKPSADHPNYRPVEFGNTNKLDTFMRNELSGSRMPVHYPAAVSNGATEIEPSIPTQPIAFVQKSTTIRIDLDTDGVTKKLIYSLPNLHDSGSGVTGRELLEIVSSVNSTTSEDITNKVAIKTNTSKQAELQFEDDAVNKDDVINVVYRLKLDNRHLIYQLGQSPVVKLISVRHIDAANNENVRSYNVIDGGLRPNEGDVWISNPNTGHITFSLNPLGGPKVHTPGQLQVEYMVNSGTMVKFIADFPKGIPAPNVEDAPTKVVVVGSGQTSITLDYAIAKSEDGSFIDPVVTVDGEVLDKAGFDISIDGKTITPNSLNAGQTVSVDYKHEKSTYDIYQVAMFDEKAGGKMFNISGIGPVTKDKNTGMRITWSVTF